MRRVGRAGALLALVALLSACGRAGMDDLTAYISEVKSRRGAPIEPLPQPKPYEAFVYQAFELRDPFSATTSGEGAGGGESMGSGSGVSPDFKRPKEVTESFPLDSLRMVGSLTRGGELWGLVRDPGGTLHRVQPGNYLGQNYGRIIRVTEERIDLVEIVQDGLGGWMERQASIALSEQ
ncbi:pilus assembly protein PilP [Endothiovibrio diazotrophicus]